MLVDNQLPIALAAYLRARGHDCPHVLEMSLDEEKDIDLWRLADREDRIPISKDEDFVILANRPGDRGRLIWARLGNCRNVALLKAFDNSLDACWPQFKAVSP